MSVFIGSVRISETINSPVLNSWWQARADGVGEYLVGCIAFNQDQWGSRSFEWTHLVPTACSPCRLSHDSQQEVAEGDGDETLEKLLLKLSLLQGGDLSFAADSVTGWLVSVAESDMNKGECVVLFYCGIGTELLCFDEEEPRVIAPNLLIFFLMRLTFNYWLNSLICKVMI